jgi:probable HAF family extracellular repeat protein
MKTTDDVIRPATMGIANRMRATPRRLAALVAGAGLVLALGPHAAADPPPAASGTTSHGFVVQRGELSTIDHPDATRVPAEPTGQAGTATLGTNDHGTILGVYEDRDGRVIRHFLLDRTGRFHNIEPSRVLPPGQSDELVDINNRGDIVGFYNDAQGFTTTAFLRTKTGRYVDIRYPGSQVTGLLKINDRRQAVGIYIDDTGLHGLLWDNGDYHTLDLQEAAVTIPTGINNRGQIVGSWIDGDGAYHGFLRQRNGRITTLPQAPGADPASGGVQPTAINDRGQIVGLVYTANGGSRAFRYDRGRYSMIVGPRATYTRATDINNSGQIVGDYGTWPPEAPADHSRAFGSGDIVAPTPLRLG